MVFEKTLENPLDCKEIQPVNHKGDQSWVFIGRAGVKSQVFGKAPDVVKDGRQEKTGTTEDEMIGLHHQLDGRGFEWTPGVDDRQRGQACCGSWGHKESDMTERLKDGYQLTTK